MSGIVFSPAAEALFRLTGPTAVSAGAGSGKTTALVELVLRLLDGRATGQPFSPAELAAITFTDKAGEELRARVRAAVAERARAAGRAGDSLARGQWLERLHALDRLAAGTIHGFCGRSSASTPPRRGSTRSSRSSTRTGRPAGSRRRRARRWSRRSTRAGRSPGPSRPCRAGVRAGWRPGSRGWCASGRLAETRGPCPWLREIRPLPIGPGGRSSRPPTPSWRCDTRRSGPSRRRWCRPSGGRTRRSSPRDRDGPLGAAALARLDALGEAARGNVGRGAPRALVAARNALKDAAEELRLQAGDVLATPQRIELAALVAGAERRYASRKRGARAVDFDDLLLLTRGLLVQDPALRAELRGGLRALLVDEYQDVNPVQQSIFEILCRAEEGQPGPTLVAVGDLKQSIYRFRGADVSVFARLIRAFGAGAGRVLHLSDNHRSAPAVLELVNEVSERALQPPLGETPRDDEIAFAPEDRLVPRRPEGARPACELLVDDEEGNAAERRLREARGIAARIRQAVKGEVGIAVRERGSDGAEQARPPRHGEVAVLFRRLTQLGPYERALREAGIPFRLARGGGFYQASEVRDVGELLAALADPEDVLAWAALLRSPACAVSDGSLFLLSRVGLSRLHRLEPGQLDAELARAAEAPSTGGGAPDPARGSTGSRAVPREPLALSSSKGERAWLPPDERARLARLLAAYRDLQALRDRVALPDLLSRAVDALDLDAALLAGPEGERRAANLEKVLALATRFAEDGGTPAELAAHLRAMAARPPREPEADLEAADAVALLTVHQAKGLEWPVVFVPDLGGRVPPDARQVLLDRRGRLCTALVDPVREELARTASLCAARDAEKRARSAESRRLLYVALTRARDHLVLSGEGNGEGWRTLVEAALAERAELVRRVPLAEVVAAREAPAAALATAVAAPPSPPRLPGPAPLPAVRMAVTELAEYARCPRRHVLGRVLGIPEPRAASAPPADDPARATARGTLAHAMLSEADLAAPPLERRAQLAAVAARRGYDPQGPGVRRIMAEVAAFAESAGGRRVVQAAQEGRLEREVPFLLRLSGDSRTAVYLVGALDALVQGREAS